VEKETGILKAIFINISLFTIFHRKMKLPDCHDHFSYKFIAIITVAVLISIATDHPQRGDSLKVLINFSLFPMTFNSGVEEAVLHWSGKSVKHAQLSTFNH